MKHQPAILHRLPLVFNSLPLPATKLLAGYTGNSAANRTDFSCEGPGEHMALIRGLGRQRLQWKTGRGVCVCVCGYTVSDCTAATTGRGGDCIFTANDCVNACVCTHQQREKKMTQKWEKAAELERQNECQHLPLTELESRKKGTGARRKRMASHVHITLSHCLHMVWQTVRPALKGLTNNRLVAID